MPSSFEIQLNDYSHRFAETYMKYKDPTKENQWRVGILKSVVSGSHSTFKFNFKNGFSIISIIYDGDNISFRSPSSKYVQPEGLKEAIYISKTGERFYKRGFSTVRYPGGKKMYETYSPLMTKMRFLEYLNPLLSFSLKSEYISAWSQSCTFPNNDDVAKQMYLPKYVGIPDALKMLLHGAYSSVAISRNFCLAHSGDSQYDLEIYNELFPFGFYKVSKNTFYVQSTYIQEMLDFLRGVRSDAQVHPLI